MFIKDYLTIPWGPELLRAEAVRKIRIILLKEDIVKVLLALSQTEKVYMVNLRLKIEEYEDLATPVIISDELDRCTKIEERLLKIAKELQFNKEAIPEFHIKFRLLSIDAMEEIVASLEQEIKLPTRNENKLKRDLVILFRNLDITRKLLYVKARCAQTKQTFLIEAWVPEKDIALVVEVIRKNTNDLAIITSEKSNVVFRKKEKIEPAPVIFKIPSFLQPFAMLVDAYGPPSPFEINPTVFMAFTFPLLFGIMFGDIGHGFLVMLGGLYAMIIKRKYAKMHKSVPGLWGTLAPLGEVIFLSGISSIVWGFIYGSFFGMDNLFGIELKPIFIARIGHEIQIGGYRPSEDIIAMFHFVLFVGILQILFGMALNILNKILIRDWKELIIGLFAMWMYGGAAYVFIFYGSTPMFNFSFWIGHPTYLLLPLGLLFLSSLAIHKTDGVIEAIMILLESLSHTISYGRMLALSVIHEVLATMTLEMFAILGEIGTVLGILVGSAVILGLEGLIVGINTLRLHWVEWFSKFYTGSGVKATPLKIIPDNVEVVV